MTISANALIQLLSATVIAALFLCVNHMTERKISARGRYLAGLILAVGFLIPLRIPLIRIAISDVHLPINGEETKVFDTSLSQGDKPPAVALPDNISTDTASPSSPSPASPETHKEFSLSFEKAVIALYLFGAIATLSRTLFRYCRTAKRLRRCGRAPTEAEKSIFLSVCRTLGIKRAPNLLVCSEAVFRSPVMFGVFRQTILISDAFSEDDLPMILGHELTHCKRRDSLTKVFFAVLGSAYWFHPLILLFIRTMNELCESSCDESFLASADAEKKRQYCRLLVLTAAENSENNTLFATLTGGKMQMKKRLNNIFTQKKKAGAVLIISLALIAAILCAVLYVVPTSVKKAIRIPASPVNLEMTEYIDRIMEYGEFGDLTKEDIWPESFELSYVKEQGSYLTFVILSRNDGQWYRQSFEFAADKMFIGNKSKCEEVSPFTLTTLSYFENLMNNVNIETFTNGNTDISELWILGLSGKTSPYLPYRLNGEDAIDYVMTANGIVSGKDYTFSDDKSYASVLIQADDTAYRLFAENLPTVSILDSAEESSAVIDKDSDNTLINKTDIVLNHISHLAIEDGRVISFFYTEEADMPCDMSHALVESDHETLTTVAHVKIDGDCDADANTSAITELDITFVDTPAEGGSFGYAKTVRGNTATVVYSKNTADGTEKLFTAKYTLRPDETITIKVYL